MKRIITWSFSLCLSVCRNWISKYFQAGEIHCGCSVPLFLPELLSRGQRPLASVLSVQRPSPLLAASVSWHLGDGCFGRTRREMGKLMGLSVAEQPKIQLGLLRLIPDGQSFICKWKTASCVRHPCRWIWDWRNTFFFHLELVLLDICCRQSQ